MRSYNTPYNYRRKANPLFVLGAVGTGCLAFLLYLAAYFTGLALVIWFVVTVLRSMGVL